MAQQQLSLLQFNLSASRDLIQEAVVGSGTSDAITATLSVIISDGASCNIRIRVPSTNTLPSPTLRLNGWSTAREIVKGDNLPLAAGDLVGWHDFRFDPTINKFVVLNPFSSSTAISSSGAGVTYFNEGRNSITPNAVSPTHYFTARGAESNIDFMFAPKGVGAVTMSIPDETAVGGNKRGNFSIDLQRVRANASQVASGNFAFMHGYNNTASGLASIALSSDNIASGDYSIATGKGSNTRGSLLKRAHGGQAQFAGSGTAQFADQPLLGQTTDNVPRILTADGSYPTTVNVSVLPDHHVYTVVAYVTARDIGSEDVASWRVEGVVRRQSGSASAMIIGTPTVTPLGSSSGATNWSATLVASTVRGSVEIEVVGELTKTIRWMCRFETIELS